MARVLLLHSCVHSITREAARLAGFPNTDAAVIPAGADAATMRPARRGARSQDDAQAFDESLSAVLNPAAAGIVPVPASCGTNAPGAGNGLPPCGAIVAESSGPRVSEFGPAGRMPALPAPGLLPGPATGAPFDELLAASGETACEDIGLAVPLPPAHGAADESTAPAAQSVPNGRSTTTDALLRTQIEVPAVDGSSTGPPVAAGGSQGTGDPGSVVLEQVRAGAGRVAPPSAAPEQAGRIQGTSATMSASDARTLLPPTDQVASPGPLAAGLDARDSRSGEPSTDSPAAPSSPNAAQHVRADAPFAGLHGTASVATEAASLSSDAPARTHRLDAEPGSPRWQQELGQRLVDSVAQGVRELRLQLTPEHLGPLEVRLRLHDSQVGLWFVAASAEARDALQSSLPRLGEMFAEAGLTMGGASVGQHLPGHQAATTPWPARPAGEMLPASVAAADLPAKVLRATRDDRLLDAYA